MRCIFVRIFGHHTDNRASIFSLHRKFLHFEINVRTIEFGLKFLTQLPVHQQEEDRAGQYKRECSRRKCSTDGGGVGYLTRGVYYEQEGELIRGFMIIYALEIKKAFHIRNVLGGRAATAGESVVGIAQIRNELDFVCENCSDVAAAIFVFLRTILI